MKPQLLILYVVSALGLLLPNGTSAQTAEKTPVAAHETTASSDKPASDGETPSSTNDDAQSQDESAPRLESIRAQMVLKVINPDEARVAVKKIAQQTGGYATHLNDSSVTLKISPQKLSEALGEFARLGIVVTKTINRQDLTLEIAQLEGKLTSQREILKRLRGFFDGSDFAATLDIERSMSALVNEIEGVKGRLRYLKEQSKWAIVEVNFRFRERERVMYVSSPFEWLNSANLEAFLEEF